MYSAIKLGVQDITIKHETEIMQIQKDCAFILCLGSDFKQTITGNCREFIRGVV